MALLQPYDGMADVVHDPGRDELGGVESDYGSDFSAEETEILSQLLTRHDSQAQPIEDNPIVNEPEYHDPLQSLRLPRVLNRDRRSAEGDIQETSRLSPYSTLPVDPGYPDCK